MQLLHSCPIPNADFASLTLLQQDKVNLKQERDNGVEYNENSGIIDNNSMHTSSFIELAITASPLSTTHPVGIHEALQELHDLLTQRIRSINDSTNNRNILRVEQSPSENNSSHLDECLNSETGDGVKNMTTDSEIENPMIRPLHDSFILEQHNSIQQRSRFAKLCHQQRQVVISSQHEKYHNHTQPTYNHSTVYQTTRTRNGILLQYCVIKDESVIQNILSIFSKTSNTLAIAAIVICIGITGSPFFYSTTPFISSLQNRLEQCKSFFLTELKTTSLKRKDSNEIVQEQKKILSLLTSIIMEDTYLKTNAMIQAENGQSLTPNLQTVDNNNSLPSSSTLTSTSRKKSSKFFSSTGMSVVKKPSKIPKKFSFTRKNKNRSGKIAFMDDGDDDYYSGRGGERGRGLSSSILYYDSSYATEPSSDVTRIISDQMQILSVAEKDMIFQQYERMRRKKMLQKDGNNDDMKSNSGSNNGSVNKGFFRSPVRHGKRSSKLDISNIGSDLAGFDFDWTTKSLGNGNDSATMSTPTSKTGVLSSSDASISTGIDSCLSSSSSYIPALSGPIKDSSISKKELRRNKVLAATVAHRRSKSMIHLSQNSSTNKLVQNGNHEASQNHNLNQRQRSSFDPFTFHDDNENLEQKFSVMNLKQNDNYINRPKLNSDPELSVTSKSTLKPDDIKIKSGLNGSSSQSNKPKLCVNVSMNEDLTCSYRMSKLASTSVEGVIQVQIESDSNSCVPFVLIVKDVKNDIKAIQENETYASDDTNYNNENSEDGKVYQYIVKVPTTDHYFPVVRYKCSSQLRPIPIRVQSKVRTRNNFCRVALQVSSNPSNINPLTDITIIMTVPPDVVGETLSTQPPGGVWNASKRSVIWCVAELGSGERFQLQAEFSLEDYSLEKDEDISFPIYVRCQSMSSQLSRIEMDVGDHESSIPTETQMILTKRFRLSHREKYS